MMDQKPRKAYMQMATYSPSAGAQTTRRAKGPSYLRCIYKAKKEHHTIVNACSDIRCLTKEGMFRVFKYKNESTCIRKKNCYISLYRI